MKRILVVAAAVTGIVMYREWKKNEETRQVWNQATDAVKN
ncbi:DLW-39 family protein [Nesterenkonia salmonea]